jgi:hypothetical protein
LVFDYPQPFLQNHPPKPSLKGTVKKPCKNGNNAIIPCKVTSKNYLTKFDRASFLSVKPSRAATPATTHCHDRHRALLLMLVSSAAAAAASISPPPL